VSSREERKNQKDKNDLSETVCDR